MDDDEILEIGEDTNKLVPSTSNARYRPVSGDNSVPRPLQVERRIAFLGHCSVGKSSIIAQFIDDHFPENYDPTIATTYTKNFHFRGRSFILHLADTAGQDEFSLEVSGCPVDVHAYILVYAINCRRSFQVVQYIYSKIIDTLGVANFPLTLVANKMDLPVKERKVSSEEGRRLAEKWNTFSCPNEWQCLQLELVS
uniref:GTP-binding protein Rheb n=1 Tax=Romanomermis culicivorax TaxID=13658 RepID=A0A915JGQ6_ROMCU